MEEPRVRFGQPFEVTAVDLPFVRNSTPRDALEQRIDRGLQVDDQVGYRRIDREVVDNLAVKGELVAVEI